MDELDYEGSSSNEEGKYSGDDSRDSGDQFSSHSDEEGDRAEDDGQGDDSAASAVAPLLSLCSRHKPGQMVEVCLTCRAALGIVRPEVAKQLLAPTGPAPSMSAAQRYAARSDDRTPTLHYSDSTMELAEGLFSALPYRNKGHFGDMVKKYLYLPSVHNEALNKTLNSEPLFRRYEGEQRFKHIFAYKRDLGDGLKSLRIIQRPLLKVTEVLDGFLIFLRSTGEAANFNFPAEAPVRSDPSCPKEYVDQLAFDDTNGTFLLPDLTPVLTGVSAQLSEEDRNIILKNSQLNDVAIREYRDFVVSQFGGLFVEARHVSQKIDALLNFYCDLYGWVHFFRFLLVITDKCFVSFRHVDASFRELLRNKLVQLFKNDFRDSVLGKDEPREERQRGRVKGLLGGEIYIFPPHFSKIFFFWRYFGFYFFLTSGEEKVRSVLADATKQDELLRKTVMPRRNPKSRVAKGGQPGTSGTQSASRPRSRSPRRSAGGRSYSGGHSKQQGKAKERGGNTGKKGGEQKKFKKDARKDGGKKGEFFSPPSFSVAWPSFFSTLAIMLVTTAGFITDRIPTLHCMKLGGRLKHCADSWKLVCGNKCNWVYNIVTTGYKMPFKSIPQQRVVRDNPFVSGPAHDVLVKEAADLIAKGAVSKVSPEDGQFVSQYFAVPKIRSPGKYRPILNLKVFNKYVKKYKFRMETLPLVRDWLKKDSWCIGLDLKDAFPHISIHPACRKFLRFRWLTDLLQWDCLPFGLTCSPRVLTKVLKPVISFIRATWGIMLSIYMDDMLIQGKTAEEVLLHAQIVMLVMMALGWSFNWEKSDLVPRQEVVHLGFVFNTTSMTITCPRDKVTRLQNKCRVAAKDGYITVHDLERLLGTMESVRPATMLAALHYRSLQHQLLQAKLGVRRPRKIVVLSRKSLCCLKWWISPTGFSGNCSASLREPEPTLDIWTDASLSRGGAHSSRGEYVQRHWTEDEQLDHINMLETRAAKEGVAQLARPGDLVRLHLDSTVALAYIRRQGGTRSLSLAAEACDLWTDAVARNVTILTPHWLSSSENVCADFLTRNSMHQWDFFLDRDLFTLILDHFRVQPTLDAFASRETRQLPRFMCWGPDNQAVASDALLHSWDPITFLFPPLPLLLKALQKVETQGIRAVLVCPKWPNAMWWPMVMSMMSEPPLPLPPYKLALHKVAAQVPLPFLDPLVAVYLSAERLG